MASRKLTCSSRRHDSRGMILIIGLLFLVVLLLLSLAMFRSFGLQERLAGNTRDKQQAFEAAESALQHGEWWLRQSAGGTGEACAGVVDGNNLDNMRICTEPLADPHSLPWAVRIDYTPPRMTVAAGGDLAANGDINYRESPGLYINFLGLSPDGRSNLYQVTAFGYGGNADTVAVVRSTYQIKTSDVKDLGGL